MSLRRLERELKEENIPQRHNSGVTGKVKVRAVESLLAAAFCVATCGHPSDSCDLHRGPWCLGKQAHTRKHICRTLTAAESSICILCCDPGSCEWAERSSRLLRAPASRMLAAKTSQTFQVPQSVSALKTIAFVFAAYLRYIITKKTPFRIGMIRHSRAGRRAL